jgi:acetyl esterase
VPLHPQAVTLLERMAAFGDPPVEQSTPDEVRARRAARWRPSTHAVHEVRDLEAAGVPCRLYRPDGAAGHGLLVWFHGGGWVLGDLDGHDHLCRVLCDRAGVAVLSVGYRLAPEAPFPAGLADALAALRWAHGHAGELGVDPDRLAVGGDSAGGNLAAVVAQAGPVPLRHQLLLYPVTDARRTSDSYRRYADGPFLTAAGMAWFVEHYLCGGQGSVDDPRVSPLLAPDHVLAGQPPTHVIVAEADPLCDEGEAYAARLREVGVRTTMTRYPGMFHGFASLSEYLDDGATALEEAAALLRLALR